jgi:radical SAM superfamily enzyme YgiQ (UPF0313 family)
VRILFISPNRLRLIGPPLPLGLAALVAAVPAGHEVAVLDFMFAPNPLGEVARTLTDFRPDLIALSLRNLDNQESRQPVTYFPEVKDLVARLKELSDVPVLLGGSGFSILPGELMEYVGADFGLVGEGEGALAAFLQAWPAGAWERVPGLVWRQAGGLRRNPPELVPDLEKLPPPALEFFNPRRYQEEEGSAKLPGMVPVQTRRGCPMKCIYCTTPLLEGRRVRAWAPEQVAGWLAAWHEKWGLTRFYFVDSIFNYPPDYARRLCLAIKELRLPLRWSCIINPAFPDGELFHLIRAAGGFTVQVGNESGSELVLRHLGKGFGREQVELTLRLLEVEGLPYTCFLLLGGPGETPATVQESVALLEHYQPRLVNLTVGVRIYPGLPLHRLALAEGLVTPTDHLLMPRFYLAPAIKEWIWPFMEGVVSRHPNWIF